VGRVSVFSLSVTILRPAGDVFGVLTDVGKAATWSSALEERLITPGPLRVGSRRRAVVPGVAGRTMENEMELTELVPDRRLAMRGVAGLPFPVRFLAELEPANGGVLLRWTTYLEPGGILKLVGPVLAAAYKRSFAKDLARLKSMMESGALQLFSPCTSLDRGTRSPHGVVRRIVRYSAHGDQSRHRPGPASARA
jgi:uncharacterized protein YndB with AHSA1/START domain